MSQTRDDTTEIRIDPERTNVVPLDRDAVDLVARARHENLSRPAYWGDSLDNDRTGVTAEAAVATRYGLPTPTAGDPSGDGGVDYLVDHAGRTERWDVKGTTYADPSLMVPETYVGPADAYVLVTRHVTPEGALFGILQGFARAERLVREANRTPSKNRKAFHYELSNDALGPVPDADAVRPVADARDEEADRS